MERCPKCRSAAIHPSRSRSRWERWRKEITGKRPFRCRECGWRGWAFAGAPSLDEVQPMIAERALAPEPPNLERAGLAREVRRSDDVDLEALDEMQSRDK